MRRAGFDVVRADYYSPVPDLPHLPASVWGRKSELQGIDMRIEEAFCLLEGELADYLGESSRAGPARDRGFRRDNGTFGDGDEDLLHAVIRWLKPDRVIEIGSGYSTLVLDSACEMNRREGSESRYDVFDPYWQRQVDGSALARAQLNAVMAQEIPASVFAELGSRDVLFIDSTHTVKFGSDVVRLILDVLPSLAPGVYVHVHDIYLPRDYPRSWIEQEAWYWTEQYLLQAFLCQNPLWEVVLPAAAMAEADLRRLRATIAGLGAAPEPGSLWMRRVS